MKLDCLEILHRPLLLERKKPIFCTHESAWLEFQVDGKNRNLLCLKSFWNSNLLSAVKTASATFEKPDFSVGLQEETNSSEDSRKRRCPLTFAAFKTEVRLFIGRGHGEIEEYKQMLVVEV